MRRQERSFYNISSCGLPSLAETPPVCTACAKKDALLPGVNHAPAARQLQAAQPAWKTGPGSAFARTLVFWGGFCI